MTPARGAAAVLTAACLLLSGCGSSGTEPTGAEEVPTANPGADPDAPTDGGVSGDDDDGLLATPGEAAVTYYRRIGAAEYASACQILAPAIQQALLRQGNDCATVVADAYGDPENRPYFLAAAVDESQVETTGDIATVPQAALSAPELPFKTEANPGSGRLQTVNPFESLDLTRLGGSWYVVED